MPEPRLWEQSGKRAALAPLHFNIGTRPMAEFTLQEKVNCSRPYAPRDNDLPLEDWCLKCRRTLNSREVLVLVGDAESDDAFNIPRNRGELNRRGSG